MFGSLTEKFQNLFTSLSKNKKLTEDNVNEAVREVRLALLEADVNYSVASAFVKRVKQLSLGDSVIKSVTPHQQFIKIVHEELKKLMGNEEVLLNLDEKPSVIMLCGLQGSGKTTHCAKLATFIQKKHNKKVLLAACDRQRPAAIEQLQKLSEETNTPVHNKAGEKKAIVIAKEAVKRAKDEGFDVVILDTAGRLHLDNDLMEELEDIKKATMPTEVLFVANATTGQDAVKIADQFNKKVAISGTILTMLDGNTRAGAAISITEVTKRPLKFEGIGERIEDIQIFNPSSMADRILGMGDVVNLVRKAEEHIDEEESKRIEKKLKKANITYDDYLRQMKMVKKMGSVKSLMKMVPGFSSFNDMMVDDKELRKIEAMILSMTKEERLEKCEMVYMRKKRIASGSGTTIDDVNRLVKGFKRIKQFLKNMPNMNEKGLKGVMPTMKELKKQMKGRNLWR